MIIYTPAELLDAITSYGKITVGDLFTRFTGDPRVVASALERLLSDGEIESSIGTEELQNFSKIVEKEIVHDVFDLLNENKEIAESMIFPSPSGFKYSVTGNKSAIGRKR